MRRGVTLIEVLITVAILFVVTAFGVTKYRDAAKRQAWLADAEKLTAALKTAQSNARTGTKRSCSTLEGWQINFTSGTTFRLEEVCVPPATWPLSTISFTGGESQVSPLPSPNPILFRVLNRGTNVGSSPIEIQVKRGATETKKIRVSSSGEIGYSN